MPPGFFIRCLCSACYDHAHGRIHRHCKGHDLASLSKLVLESDASSTVQVTYLYLYQRQRLHFRYFSKGHDPASLSELILERDASPTVQVNCLVATIRD